jgi:hypothetical protein
MAEPAETKSLFTNAVRNSTSKSLSSLPGWRKEETKPLMRSRRVQGKF